LYREQIARLFERSAFYRRKLAAAGFDSPAAVGGLERLDSLPFTEKDELRASQAESPPLGSHAAVDIAEVARIYSTSGTSGTPLYIPLTRNDVEDWRAIGRDTYSKNGLKAGDSVVTTFGAGPFVAGASLAAFEAIGCTHIPIGVGNTEKLLAALRHLKPKCLGATPSYALHVAEKLGGAKSSLERVIVGGEPGGGEDGFRKKLQDALGVRVYEIMGIGDVAASLWGECPEQAGMHFSGGDSIHVELVDPDFAKILQGVKAESFDDGKVSFLEGLGKKRFFTCDQARQILATFSFDDDRVKAAVLLYPQLVDQENFFMVLKVFTFDSSRKSVRAKLNLK